MENLEIACMIIPLAMQVAKPPISDWNSRTVSLLSRRPSSRLGFLHQIWHIFSKLLFKTWRHERVKGGFPWSLCMRLRCLRIFFHLSVRFVLKSTPKKTTTALRFSAQAKRLVAWRRGSNWANNKAKKALSLNDLDVFCCCCCCNPSYPFMEVIISFTTAW